MILLEFQKEMLKKILSEDSLTIISTGLGLEFVLLALIEIYHNPKNLILILNAEKQDSTFILSKLGNTENVKVISSKISTKERVKCYISDGILFISPRLLIYDMLVRKIPVDLVTGVLIFNSHTVVETVQLEFVLKMFRESNKTAFIKSFSDHPSAFTSEFNQITRVSSLLFAKTVDLWPRFHLNISAELDSVQIDVTEIVVTLSNTQSIIQAILIDILSKVLQDFLKSAPELASYKSLFTIDSVISTHFYSNSIRILPLLVGQYSRALYYDIKVLRKLVISSIKLNTFEFYQKLLYTKESYRLKLSDSNPILGGDWILWDITDSLFYQALECVNNLSETSHAKKDILKEISPKWKALSEIVDEIRQKSEEPSNVLILTLPNSRITEYFRYRLDSYKFINRYVSMFSNIINSNNEKTGSNESSQSENIPEITNITEKSIISEDEIYSIITQVDRNKSNQNEACEEIATCCEKEKSNHALGIDKINIKVCQAIDSYEVRKILDDFKPKYIIMYDSLLEWIRIIETHQCAYSDIRINVYMVFCQNSIEEKMYLTSLNQEKQAYEILIHEKALMAKTNVIKDLEPDSTIVDDSRKIEEKKLGIVIVDVREFGSELPLALYKSGFQVKPIILEIGDYILTQDAGIERKSLPDLVSSLNSGRLYQQALALSRYYSNAYILIEFTPKSFKNGILSNRLHSKETKFSNVFYVQNKLILLILHCPLIRILWSSCLDYSCKLFKELKYNKPEPDQEIASSVTSFEAIDSLTIDSNKSCDLLLKLPGVTFKNIRNLTKKAKNFIELSRLSIAELSEVVDDAQKVFDFFNIEFKYP